MIWSVRLLGLALARLDREPFHGGLVPRDTRAWPVRYVNRAATNLKRLRRDRIAAVAPFQPVGGFRDANQMSGKLRIEMR
jgi:hypothetical protein